MSQFFTRDRLGVNLALAAVAIGISTTAIRPAIAQNDPIIKFDASEPTMPGAMPTLFDVMDTGKVSPLGEAAESLEPAAMAERAKGYLEGSAERPKNLDEAGFWLRKLAIQPLADKNNYSRWALESLANDLLPDDPKKRDANTMRQLQLIWELLALSGDPRAMCNMGFMYSEGIGVARDLGAARVWFERADAAGCADAQEALAILN